MSKKMIKKEKKPPISDIDDHIRNTFEIKKRLGKGAYGIVWKATDKKTSQTVAIKKIFEAFRNETDAQRTFREIMFLRAFRNHPNIIQLYSIHRASNHMDIYLSFEFMESDLHNVIKRGSILKDIHKRYIMYQLFNATKFIHSGNVIHRDMKPSNVLIDSKCRCKLADFGLARSLSMQYQMYDKYSSAFGDTDKPCLTDYVATRWYRAPEILIANKSYTKGIDMWSLGCILGEMVRGKPLFPGSCTVKQVECIVRALPPPSDRDLKAVGDGFGTCLLNRINETTNSPDIFPKLDEMLVDATSDAKRLIVLLLQMNPAKRLTALQALDHEYVERFRTSLPEVELTQDVLPPFRDDVQFSISEYRSKLYEIMSSSEKYIQKKELPKKNASFSSSPITSSQSTNSIEYGVTHSSDIQKLYREFGSLSTHSQQKNGELIKSQINVRNNNNNKYSTTTTTANKKTVEVSSNLNCCKNCIQKSNENRKALVMPKLPNSFQSEDESKLISNGNKSSKIFVEMRRNSINANTYFRQMTNTNSNKQQKFHSKSLDNEYRRKSLDEDIQQKKIPNKHLSKRILSSFSQKHEPRRKLLISSKTESRDFTGIPNCNSVDHASLFDKKMHKNKYTTEPRAHSTILKKIDEKFLSRKFLNEYKYAY